MVDATTAVTSILVGPLAVVLPVDLLAPRGGQVVVMDTAVAAVAVVMAEVQEEVDMAALPVALTEAVLRANHTNPKTPKTDYLGF